MRSDGLFHKEIQEISESKYCSDDNCWSCPHFTLSNREAFNRSMDLVIELLLDIRSHLRGIKDQTK